ncbi:signal transduction histidine kinase [Deinobacterium chartae]|uniref:histidine kinase n=1 Tax=Deinobacterium chartae TaxID=521158 RepID=A0A841I0N8_9DEIO|nr:ATP-binding protein [Deinobacterium chartae]MBB6098666.1 signal transduction histidine kinase [Deinobacterium chartae]
MPIRWRLTALFALLCAAALVVVSLVGYGVYVRDQYLATDRVLSLSARHVAAGVQTAGRSHVLEAAPGSVREGGVQVVLRLYDAHGRLLARSPGTSHIPATDPAAPLATRARPAYHAPAPLTRLARTPQPPEGSAYGTLTLNGERWRRYVIRLDRNGVAGRYVEALTPLARLDQASAQLARTLTLLTLASVLLVAGLGWTLVGLALRPVARLTQAAREIARSRDLSRRVPHTGAHDEIGRLGGTFNDMLDSLEGAVRSQQRFVADASHELRVPLTVLRGNLELLRRHPALAAHERGEIVQETEREAARLSRLVSDLLLLARVDADLELNLRALDLRAVALEAFRDARLLAQGQILRFEDGPPLWVRGDADRLKQLLLILLDNAIKFTPAPGTVGVVLRLEGEQVQLEVQDHGVGIREDEQPLVFERFFRGEAARAQEGGSGLGLAIARWIVQQHRGDISLRSRPGEGTVVTVRLPALETVSPATAEAAAG